MCMCITRLKMAVITREQRNVPTSFQSTKPSSSFSQSQKSRKLDFEHVIYLLDLEPEDSSYKLLSALTNNGKLSMVSFISLSKSELKEIRVVDANKTTLAFDDWEVLEIFNIYSYFMHKKCETNEDFQLRDIELASFEDSKLRSIYFQMTRTREDMSRSSSTRGQPNSSRPSIKNDTSVMNEDASVMSNDTPTSSTIPSFENSLNTIVEESSSSSFESSQENNSIASSESNHDNQPTLHSIFHDAIDSNDDPAEQKVNNRLTSSEELAMKSAFSDLLGLETASNGERGSIEPHESDCSSSTSSREGGSTEHCSSSTSSGKWGATESSKIDSDRNKSTFLEPLKSEEIFCDNLNMISTKFTSPIKDSRKSYDFEVDCSFRYQLFDAKLREFEDNEHSHVHSDFDSASSRVSPSAPSTSEDLRFSRTYLLNLESILLRSLIPHQRLKKLST